MLFTGNQRGGAASLAKHLLSTENDHVELHDIRGFSSETLGGALQEAQAMSRGTRCQQFLYSLSINPPPKEPVGLSDFEAAIDQAEEALGLTGQPRVIIFHEKEGRRHAQAVWSRIDTENMRAINMAFPKNKLMEVSRELFLQHGWKMPDGFRPDANHDATNYSHEEHQQAKRTNKDAATIKRLFQQAWSASDSRDAFAAAIKEQGFLLARGKRRGFVAVDHHGEVFSVARQIGVKAKEVREKLGDPVSLPSVEETQGQIADGKLAEAEQRADDLKAKRKRALEEFRQRKTALVEKQRIERQAFDAQQQKQQTLEAQKRQARFRTGLKGLWDRLRGEHGRIKKLNEAEALAAEDRDRKERDELIQQHLNERRALAVFALSQRRDATQQFHQPEKTSVPKLGWEPKR